MSRGEMNADPVAEEFFTTEALSSSSDALVREVVQNSLDATRPGEVARLRFNLTGTHTPLAAEVTQGYLQGLLPHLEQVFSSSGRRPWEAPLTYLTVEDYGTSGLTGSPTQDIDLPGVRNNFFYFFRNIGRSRKADVERGRWGLGKTVLPASSRIRSFLAVTQRADDSRRLLMGQ